MQQRQCVILKGDIDWCRSASEIVLADFDAGNTLWLTEHAAEKLESITQKQAQQYLGKEFNAVIFDALEQFDPDSLGIILGTIKAGGVLILWLSQASETGLWQQRFNQISIAFNQKHDSFSIVQQGQSLPKLLAPVQRGQSDEVYLSDDQKQAVSAILRVVQGHRRRPLVLSSDRGRGKSAALGIAAAQLITQGKKTILVTAPSLTIVDTVFELAGRYLPDAQIKQGLISINDAEIKFVAPDALIEFAPKADLLLVDEVAAIPATMLEQLLTQYSRIVFATTLHGYEGTGRGFAVRLQQILQKKTPDWHHYQMNMPIRWAEDDMLEAFSFEALLLNALPVADELIAQVQADLCEFEVIDRTQLVNDETSLRELFGLMVLAHYRTRPADLQMMLDRDDVSVYIMRYQGHIVASAWLVKEGGLGDELSSNIYAGERRLKGHLLPQSLLAHAGINSAGSLNYQRIIRLAVHPVIQQRGIGTALIQQIIGQISSNNDVLGASFGVSQDLLSFWSHSGFVPVRLGIHKSDVDGSHAVIMLQNTSVAGQTMLNDAALRFQQQWPHLLHTHFKTIAPELVVAISQLMSADDAQLSQWDIQEINAFALSQRGFEFSQVSLCLWLNDVIRQPNFCSLTDQQQQLCVMAILQQCDWADIVQVLQYTGKAQAVTALREAVANLLSKL